MIKKLLFIALIAVQNTAYSQLTTQSAPANTYGDPVWLVNNVLSGNGVTISNITFDGEPLQIGFFDGSNSNIGINSGIVMATDGISALGPNQPNNQIGITATSDQDLLDIANSVPQLINETFTVSQVNDVASLEFDFTPSADTIEFNYVFASSEYNQYEFSSFNDIFAFFISGPGISGPYAAPAGFPNGAQNIAFVPGTNPELPITVSSVNTTYNTAYYIDNTALTTVDACDGFTTKLTARAIVQCNQTYHIKLAIADGSDAALISAIFLEAGSFSSPGALGIAALTNNGDNTIIEGCDSTEILFTRIDSLLVPDTVNFEIIGSATNGTDYNLLPNQVVFENGANQTSLMLGAIDDGISEGLEKITFVTQSISVCGDTISDSTSLFINDPHSIDVIISDPLTCDDPNIELGATSSINLANSSYLWSSNETTENILVSNNNAGLYSLTLTDSYGCTNSGSIDLGSIEIPNAAYEVLVSVSCFSDSALVSFTPENLKPTESYTWTIQGEGSFTQDTFALTTAFIQNLQSTLVVTNDFGCKDSISKATLIGPFNEYENEKIPNYFTPNQDGENDVFSLDNYQYLEECLDFEVLNRWGKTVFESEPGQLFWDGNNQKEGVYFYVISFRDMTETGTVHLFR